MKNLKNQNGITLIALVITIIVLLILAGVTIGMLTGENGILKNAQLSSEEYEIDQGKERIELILAEVKTEEIATGTEKTVDELVEILEGKDGISGAEKTDENKIKVTTEEGYIYEVTINENGKTEVAHTGKGESTGQTTPISSISIETGTKGTDGLYVGDVAVKLTGKATGSAITKVTYELTGATTQEETEIENEKIIAINKAGTTTITVYEYNAEGTKAVQETLVLELSDISQIITENSKSATIPRGFVASSVEGENTIEGGLVIYEGTEDVTTENHATALTERNQYVWIPVDDINSMSMCKSNAEGSVCNLKIQTDGTLKCTVHADTATQIVGRLYANKGTNGSYLFDFTTTNQTYNANSGYREPAVVTGAYGEMNNYHGYGTASAFLEELEKEYIKMATGVAKNGGFYVARYEIGTAGASKKDKAVINAGTSSANMWYGLYKIAKSANQALNSHMIWGSQYGQIVKFIGADAQTVSQDRQTTAASNSGSNSSDKMKNIYDLESNYNEWTSEAYGDNSRVIRGNSYWGAYNGAFNPACYAVGAPVSDTYVMRSTRITLYL